MQDFRSHTKHSSLRGKAEKENANLLQKRSRTPPMIQSLSAEAKLSKAEAILQAIREKGCPESKGMLLLSALVGLLAKLVRSRWRDIGLVIFFACL